MLGRSKKISLRRQAYILQVSRSSYYYKPKLQNNNLTKKVVSIYKKYPIYGYRRIHAVFKTKFERLILLKLIFSFRL